MKQVSQEHAFMLLQMQYLLASQGAQGSGGETAKLVRMLKFLGALGCSAQEDPSGQCESVAREVQALSAQINAGQNFYGERRRRSSLLGGAMPLCCRS